MKKCFKIFIKYRNYIKLIWLITLTLVYLLPFFSPKKIEEVIHSTFRIDYVLHFLVFGFTGFVFFANSKFKNVSKWFLIFVVYSFLMEIIQQIFLNRYFNLLDVLANIFGLGLGLIVITLLNKYMSVKSNLKIHKESFKNQRSNEC